MITLADIAGVFAFRAGRSKPQRRSKQSVGGIMGVRSVFASGGPSLVSSEGELVSLRICIEPRLLEELLEALASVSFPINPQIYHHAGVGYVYPDGHEQLVSTTMVEFPAFSGHLEEVQNTLRAHGLPPDLVHVKGMIQDIHSDHGVEPAPDGVSYQAVNLYRQFPEASTTTSDRWPT
jgi:hypothetical protein